MASTVAASPQLLSTFLRRRPATLSTLFRSWQLSNLASASISIPAISINVPGLLSDIWEGLLRAVPKKKTSHAKKRHRQLAGKALKDVKAVTECPGCGRPKKAHTLCPYCVAEIYDSWKQRDAEEQEMKKTLKEDKPVEMEEEQLRQEKKG